MSETGLIDRFGKPFRREVMTQRIASATLSGVRQAVGGSVTRGLTPADLARILREAEDGDPESYLRLAEEMEEKEPQYIATLGVRKRQVAQLEVHLETGGTTPRDKAIAEAVQEHLIDSDLIDGAMMDMLDAVGKGFSVHEILWDLSGAIWKPVCLDYVDPRFFDFDRATRRIPLLIGAAGERRMLDPYKFLYLELKSKSGIPVRGGLARPIAWCWMFKNFAIKDWIEFLDIYGIPLRLGSFPPGATENDINALLRAVASIASDAAAVKPSNMDIEFKEANASASSDAHERMVRYFDGQISKLVLGQTGTTDATGASGLGSGTEHTQVREDIERADAKALAKCFNTKLIRPFVDLNFGEQKNYPYMWIGRPDQTDGQLMVNAARDLVPLGLRLRQADLRGVIGAKEPEDGDELFPPPAAPVMPGFGFPGSAHQPGNATLASASLMALAAEAAGGKDAIQREADAVLADWKELVSPEVDQILALAKTASGDTDAERFADFRKQLTALYPQIDTNAMAQRLAILTFQAFAGGVAGDRLE